MLIACLEVLVRQAAPGGVGKGREDWGQLGVDAARKGGAAKLWGVKLIGACGGGVRGGEGKMQGEREEGGEGGGGGEGGKSEAKVAEGWVERGRDVLLEILGSGMSGGSQEWAAWGLGRICLPGDTEAEATLVKCAQGGIGGGVGLRTRAFEGLGAFGGEGAVGAVLEGLMDSNGGIRESARRALRGVAKRGGVGGKKALEGAVRMLRGVEDGGRRAAVIGIACLCGRGEVEGVEIDVGGGVGAAAKDGSGGSGAAAKDEAAEIDIKTGGFVDVDYCVSVLVSELGVCSRFSDQAR